MRGLVSAISVIATILGSLSLLMAESLDMIYPDIPHSWQYWGLALFIVGVGLPTIITQLDGFSTSKIQLDGWGIQQDKGMNIPVVKKVLWWSKEDTVKIEFPALWIQISNRPGWGLGSIEGIFPRISWYDCSGNFITRNNGRWWLSNVHTYQDTSLLQTINLDPNNQVRLLHFARFLDGQLHAWFRTQDNAEPSCPLPEGEYYIEIELRSNSGQKANYSFLVSYFRNELSLKRIKGWQRIKRKLTKKKM